MERRWIAVALLSVLSGCNYYDSPHLGCWEDERPDRDHGRTPRLADGGALDDGALDDGALDDGALADSAAPSVPCPGGCAADEACVEGACTPLDALCRHATDCGPGRACVDNACRPHCADDADCAHGTACADGLCVPASECAGADDCPADADCLEMRCLTRCAMNPECGPDARCVAGVCRPDVAPRPFCASDADCAAGHLCVAGVCRTPCPSGEDAECLRWDAQLVQCAEPEPGLRLCYTRGESNPECVTRSDCDPSRHCIDGLCR